MKLSVISAAFNEENVLPIFLDHVISVCSLSQEKLDIADFELIVVDDGSSDSTWDIIKQRHQQNQHIKGIRFSRNFGHHAAIMAGLDAASGNYIIYMDSDMQAQPEDIPKLINEFRQGFDIVWGVATARKDSLIATLGAKAFRWIFRRASRLDIPRNAVMAGCSRRAAENIKRLREFNRFSLGLWTYVGFHTAFVPVEKKSRLSGNVKYNLMKRVSLAITSLVGFSTFPLKLSSYLGFSMAVIGILMGFFIVIRKIFLGIAIAGYASLFAVITLFAGLQFLMLGIIGEYIGIILSEVKQRPIYVVEQRLE
ncbi:MAG: glycosyltransferase [Dissulfurispiraceae bacterium]